MTREIKSISLLTSASIVQVGALALLSVVLAKLLSVEDFGITRLVTAYFMILTMLGHFCLNDAVSAYAAGETNPELQKSYVSMGAILVVALSAVIAVGSVAMFQISDYWQGNLKRALVIVAIFLPAMTLTILFSSVLRAIGNFRGLNLFLIASGLVPLLVIAPLSAIWGIDGWIFSRVATLALLLFVVMYFVRTLLRFQMPRPQQVRPLLSFARVQFGSGLLSMVMQSADVLYLERFGNGLKQVGIYALAALFTKSVMILPEAIGRIYFRKIAANNSDRDSGKSIVDLLTATVLTSVVLAVLIATLVPPLIQLIYGEEYLASVEVLRTLSVGMVPSGVWIALSTINIAAKRPRHALYISTVGAVVCLIALPLLVPRFGAVGAAWAMNLSSGAGALVGLSLLFTAGLRTKGMS